MKKASMFVVAAIVAFLPLRAVAFDYNNPFPYYQSHQRGLEKMRRGECAKAYVIFRSEKPPFEERIKWVLDGMEALECLGLYDMAIETILEIQEIVLSDTGKRDAKLERKLVDLQRKQRLYDADGSKEYTVDNLGTLLTAEVELQSEDKARERADAEDASERRRNARETAARQREIAKDEFDRGETERLLRDLFLHNYFHFDLSYRAPVTWDHLYSSKKIYTIGGQILWFGVDYLSDTYKNKPTAGKEAEPSPGWQFTITPVTLGTWTGAETLTSKPKRDLEISFGPYLGYRLGGAWLGGGEIAVMSTGIRFSLLVERVSSGGGMPGGSRLGLGIGFGH